MCFFFICGQSIWGLWQTNTTNGDGEATEMSENSQLRICCCCFTFTSSQYVSSFQSSSEKILRPCSEFLHLNQQTASCHFLQICWRVIVWDFVIVYSKHLSSINYILLRNFALLEYHPTFILYIVYIFVFFPPKTYLYHH